VFIGAVLGLVPACGTPFDDPEHVRAWVNTGSAVGVYLHGYEPIAVADGEVAFRDSTCPETEDDGTRLIISGPCVDASEAEWFGSVTIVRSNGDRSVTFDGWGQSPNPDLRSTLATLSGTLELERLDDDDHEYRADWIREGGVATRVAYLGRVRGGYTGPTTWNGRGEVERTGLVAPTGTARVATIDEVVDDEVCSGQPSSGRTEIAIGDSVAVVTYDGATDCDADQAARLEVDGEERGRISGVTCSIDRVGERERRPDSAVLGLVLTALGLARRRRRRSGASVGALAAVAGLTSGCGNAFTTAEPSEAERAAAARACRELSFTWCTKAIDCAVQGALVAADARERETTTCAGAGNLVLDCDDAVGVDESLDDCSMEIAAASCAEVVESLAQGSELELPASCEAVIVTSL
jgi:hypothetical protein